MKEMHKLRISSWLVYDTSSSIYSPHSAYLRRTSQGTGPTSVQIEISHTFPDTYIFLTYFKLWSQGMGYGGGKLVID